MEEYGPGEQGRARIIIPEESQRVCLAVQLYFDKEPYLRFWEGWNPNKEIIKTAKEFGVHLSTSEKPYKFMGFTFKKSNFEGVGLAYPIFFPKDSLEEITLYDAYGWIRVDEQHIKDMQSYLPKGIELIKDNGEPLLQTC